MKLSTKSPKVLLADFLKIAPLSHALWRSVEALSFSGIDLKSPVLDIGCGFGEFAGVVFERVEMGIDINEKELSQALKGKKYKKVKWADARHLPFKDDSYNTVVSVSVMEHIENADEVIKEVARVLKKGGLFVFSVPTISMRDSLLVPKILKSFGLKTMADKYWDLHTRAFKHVNLKNSAWWEKSLNKAGFKIVRKQGTLSKTVLRLHEMFLITAMPSQFGKLFFGKRLIMSIGLRSKFLPMFFGRFVKTDQKSDINIFYVAQK